MFDFLRTLFTGDRGALAAPVGLHEIERLSVSHLWHVSDVLSSVDWAPADVVYWQSVRAANKKGPCQTAGPLKVNRRNANRGVAAADGAVGSDELTAAADKTDARDAGEGRETSPGSGGEGDGLHQRSNLEGRVAAIARDKRVRVPMLLAIVVDASNEPDRIAGVHSHGTDRHLYFPDAVTRCKRIRGLEVRID